MAELQESISVFDSAKGGRRVALEKPPCFPPHTPYTGGDCEPDPAQRLWGLTWNLLPLDPSLSPPSSLRSTSEWEVGRKEKAESKGMQAPRPPGTSFPQGEIYLALDGAFIKDKTLSVSPFPSPLPLPCPMHNSLLDRQAEQVPYSAGLGACDRAGPNWLYFRPGRSAEASRKTAMWV